MLTAIDVLTFMLYMAILIIAVGGFVVWLLVKLMEKSFVGHYTSLKPARCDKNAMVSQVLSNIRHE